MRPSSLPFLAACPCWESDQAAGVGYKQEGQDRHTYLAALLRCELGGNDGADVEDAKIGETLSEQDREASEWAASYIQTHAPTSDFPLLLEYHVNPLDVDFAPIFENGGTLDAACGNQLFDFKWRERDYGPQLAAYALHLFQEHGFSEVKAHVLFGESRKAEAFILTEPECENIVYGILHRATAPDRQPTPCDYCGWCAKRLTCPAIVRTVETVAKGYSDLEKVKSWHPSEMQTGEELGIALWIWRTILKKWGDSVEYHALEASQKKGQTIAGFEAKSKAGKTYITDVPQAFALAGLPQAEFLAGCQVRLNTSKKYPDQKGLSDIYAQFHGLKKTPAAKDLLKKLEPVVKKTKDTVYLRAVKGAMEEESDE